MCRGATARRSGRSRSTRAPRRPPGPRGAQDAVAFDLAGELTPQVEDGLRRWPRQGVADGVCAERADACGKPLYGIRFTPLEQKGYTSKQAVLSADAQHMGHPKKSTRFPRVPSHLGRAFGAVTMHAVGMVLDYPPWYFTCYRGAAGTAGEGTELNAVILALS